MNWTHFTFPFYHSAFFLTDSSHSPFQGLLPDINAKTTIGSYREHWKRNSFFLPHQDQCSGLVLFGGVFDLQQVSEACFPEEHRANIVGNLFYSR